MKAIIIPGMNDMNKGDQALIWESVRLVEDTALFDTVKVMANGDTPEEMEELCSQSRSQGIKLVYNILPHPRRGKHQNDFREKLMDRSRLVFNALKDFFSRNFLLNNLDRPVLLSLFFDQNTLHTLREFREADVIFVKGGGFIHAYGEMSAPYLMWYFLFYIKLAKKFNKKVIVLPNSFGPLKGLRVKSQVKKALQNADLIYAREQKSADELSKLLNREIPVAKDLGFFLEKSENENLQNLIPFEFRNSNVLKIGMTVRPWRFPGSTESTHLYENYINVFCELIKNVIKDGHIVLFFNQRTGPNSHEDDRIAIADIMERIGDNPNVIWVNKDYDCRKLQALYSGLDAMVGTRFHSVIFSLNSIIPSLAIGYGGNKASGIMSDFQLSEFIIPIDDLTAELLLKKFQELIKRKDSIRSYIAQYSSEIYRSRTQMISEIIKVMS